tara:strand:+ start:177 stop:635 length:459 start_codon:yes stop_codon:yes gene_type:complete
MGVTKSAQDKDKPMGVAKDPGLTPYATNVGSAVVTPGDIEEWKAEQATSVKSHFTERFKELKEAYDELLEDFNWNKLIYDEVEVRFKPIIGKEYYLYQKYNSEHKQMSLIAPYEWNDMKDYELSYIGTFKQDSRQKWIHIRLDDNYTEISDE